MKRYSSVQSSRVNNYLSNDKQQDNSNSNYNIDEMEVEITKIKRDEIKIKEPWSKAPNLNFNCGKSHNDQSEHIHVSAQKWLENRIKKRNQERALLKAINRQKELDEQFKDCIYEDKLHDDNNKQTNQQNKASNSGTASQLRQEKVLWKKRMIYELHDINRFMDEYNQEQREERAILKRQKIFGDLGFNDKDQKKLEHHKEQKDRLNQLHKRLYGHESLERVLAKGLIKELLQDFIKHQISIGIKEKDELTETITINSKQINAIKQRHNSIEQKQPKDQENVLTNRKEQYSEPLQKKIKSKSYHSTYYASNSPDKKTSKKKLEKSGELGTLNTLERDTNEKEEEGNKNHFKTRSDIHFQNIDKINKQIKSRIIKNENQQYVYTFAQSQAIRDLQSDQILEQNKQRQSLIEEQFSNQYSQKKDQETACQRYNSMNAKSQRTSDHISSSQFNHSQDDIFMSIINKSLVYLDKNEKSMKNVNQNISNLKQQTSIAIQECESQTSLQDAAIRESLKILGDQELGKDYFKYLRKNNEQQQQKQEEEIKKKLKDNPSVTKILAMRKIENITKLQNFYDDYINHIQTKILNNKDKVPYQKFYVQKPEYKSLSVLPNMQKKAEQEEEEKQRKIREEEEKRNAKKVRVFKKFQSQNDISQYATTINAKTNKQIENQSSKQMDQSNIKPNPNEDGAFSQIYDKILSINLKKNQIIQENDQDNTVKQQTLNQNISTNRQNSQSPSKQINSLTKNKEFINKQIQDNLQFYKDQNETKSKQKRDKSPLTLNNIFKGQNNTQQKFQIQISNKQDDQGLTNSNDNNNQMNTIGQQQDNFNVQSQLKNESESKLNECNKDNKFRIKIQQQEFNQPQNLQEINSPLVKRMKEDKINHFQKQANQTQYYTPQKVINDLENPQKDQISMSNRNTTAESPDIRLRYKQNQSARSEKAQGKSDSVGRVRSFQNIRNISISHLQGSEKVNQQSYSSLKTNRISNASFIEKVINLNKQCISEIQNVNKINKHILQRQKRNLRTFTKLDDMVNNII